MAVLYGIVRSQNIKLLPLSLCAVAVVTFGGPWGAYTVSHNSQTQRFTGLLERNGMLEDGRAIAASSEVSLEDRQELSGSLSYLLANHGTGHLTELLGPDLAATDSLGGMDAIRRWEARDRAGAILRTLGLEYVEASAGPTSFFNFRADPREPLSLEGYDYSFETNGSTITVPWAEDSLTIELDRDAVRLDVRSSQGVQLLSVPLGGMIEQADEHDRSGAFDSTHTIPREVLRADATGGGLRVALFVESIHGERTDEGYRVTGVAATWLVDVVEGDAPVAFDTSAAAPAAP